MPKPVQRVSDARTKQAVFAASIKQFPKRLVVLTEGDSWFSYPLNCNIADYLEMMSDFSMLRLEHNGDEAREILGSGSEQLKKLKYYLKKYPVDALFLSAGGNDLVARKLAKFLDKKVNGGTWQSTVKLAAYFGSFGFMQPRLRIRVLAASCSISASSIRSSSLSALRAAG